MKNNRTIAAMIIIAAVVVVAGVAAYTFLADSSGEESSSMVGKTLSKEQLPSDDSRLWVFGNADEDDKLDADDLAYLQKIISGE